MKQQIMFAAKKISAKRKMEIDAVHAVRHCGWESFSGHFNIAQHFWRHQLTMEYPWQADILIGWSP